MSICSVTFLTRRQNREKSTKFVADSLQIVPINTFVNVNHALNHAWKNQKIDRVNIANKFKGAQMQFLKIQQVCVFGMVSARMQSLKRRMWVGLIVVWGR